VDIGKTEARLPKKEQSKLENFSVGDRVRCVIKSVDKAGKTPGVIVSRAAPELVVRLFEQEVPEIYDNTVIIKGCAREAGERTKIAVHSRDRDVDSVGACVGMKGMRVQSIIRELRGEKIDIIEFSDDPVTFATHALSPAKISRVTIVDAAEKHMEVIVDDSQLSLAIGKKGQNVRLGAKLIGWKIDIKSEEEKRQEVESQMAALVVAGAPVSVLIDHGLAEKVVEKLIDGGIGTVEKLGAMTPEQLEEIAGIGPKTVEAIQIAVNSYYAQFEDVAEEAAAPETGEDVAIEQLPEGSAEDEAAAPVPEHAEGSQPAVESAADMSSTAPSGDGAANVEAAPVAEQAAGENQPAAESAGDLSTDDGAATAEAPPPGGAADLTATALSDNDAAPEEAGPSADTPECRRSEGSGSDFVEFDTIKDSD
jgi:N utilization substance protein A